MKTRTGFVSNSSSSSFILAFPKRMESRHELKETLWPGRRHLNFLSDYRCTTCAAATEAWQQYQIAERITSLRSLQHRVRHSEIIHPYQISYYDPSNHNTYNSAAWKKQDRIFQKRNNQRREGLAKEFWERVPRAADVVMMEYSDNGEGIIGVVLEHSQDAWINIPYIQISHH